MASGAVVKSPAEVALCDIDCSLLIGPAQQITAVDSVTADGLSISAWAVNQASLTYLDGRVVASKRVIQVKIGGGTVPTGHLGREYVVSAKFRTAVVGELLEARCRLLVTNEP